MASQSRQTDRSPTSALGHSTHAPLIASTPSSTCTANPSPASPAASQLYSTRTISAYRRRRPQSSRHRTLPLDRPLQYRLLLRLVALALILLPLRQRSGLTLLAARRRLLTPALRAQKTSPWLRCWQGRWPLRSSFKGLIFSSRPDFSFFPFHSHFHESRTTDDNGQPTSPQLAPAYGFHEPSIYGRGSIQTDLEDCIWTKGKTASCIRVGGW